jgi:hypothetical protein
MNEVQNPHLQNPPVVHNLTTIISVIQLYHTCATDRGMCTSEYTLHHNINEGNKTGEELIATKLLPVTNITQKNFWNTVK